MKNILLTVSAMVFAAFAALGFSGCKPAEVQTGPVHPDLPVYPLGGEISGKIANLSALDPDATYTVQLNIDDEMTGLPFSPVAADGSFTVPLPESVPTQYMIPAEEEFGGIDGVATVGNDVLIGIADIVIFKNGTPLGYLDYSYLTRDEDVGTYLGAAAQLVYSTGRFMAVGTHVEDDQSSYVASVSLSVGWSLVYAMDENNAQGKEIYTMTSTEPTLPDGKKLQWHAQMVMPTHSNLTSISGTIANADVIVGLGTETHSLKLVDWDATVENAPMTYIAQTWLEPDGSFTLQLPESGAMDEKWFEKTIDDDFGSYNVPITETGFYLVGNDGKNYLFAYNSAPNGPYVSGGLVYTNHPCDLSDLHFRPGWNWKYYIERITAGGSENSLSTTLPEGTELEYQVMAIPGR
jgi:hypothetical protein